MRAEAEQALEETKLLQAEKRQQSLGASFGIAQNDVADMAIAEFFFANGLSFAAADPSPGSYYHQMIATIKATTSGYVPPRSAKIAGPVRCLTGATRRWRPT